MRKQGVPGENLPRTGTEPAKSNPYTATESRIDERHDLWALNQPALPLEYRRRFTGSMF